MKILLDENFPLPLYRRLLETGHEAEHVIVLGQRGAPDAVLRDRLVAEELVLLTQDTEFERLPSGEIVAWAVDTSPEGVSVRRTTRRF